MSPLIDRWRGATTFSKRQREAFCIGRTSLRYSLSSKRPSPVLSEWRSGSAFGSYPKGRRFNSSLRNQVILSVWFPASLIRRGRQLVLVCLTTGSVGRHHSVTGRDLVTGGERPAHIPSSEGKIKSQTDTAIATS